MNGLKEVETLKKLAGQLKKPLYIVGGFVRNFLGGFKDKSCDIDICSNFDGAELLSLGINAVPINKRLGTVKISYNGFFFEYTRFRAESYKSGGSHTPQKIEFIDDLNQDALRRDFAINSIYYEVLSDRLFDPLNGLNDIKNRLVRCAHPQTVFASDGLRLLRLCRFAAQTGYKIEPKTLRAAKDFCANLNDIAMERKRDELDKILVADTRYGVKNAHYRGLKLISSLGLWQYLMPSIDDMKIPQNPKYHRYNVLEHTFRAVKYSPPHLRLAALLHDIGKPISQKLEGNMHAHAALGAQEAERLMLSLGYPTKTIERVKRLIELHMFDLKQSVRDAKMRLFVAENFDLIDDLQQLVIADGRATGQKIIHKPRFLQFKHQLLREGVPLRIADLRINGDDCVRAGLCGAEIGKTLELLWKECIVDGRLNKRERLLKRIGLD